jgi:hypothetical protein
MSIQWGSLQGVVRPELESYQRGQSKYKMILRSHHHNTLVERDDTKTNENAIYCMFLFVTTCPQVYKRE